MTPPTPSDPSKDAGGLERAARALVEKMAANPSMSSKTPPWYEELKALRAALALRAKDLESSSSVRTGATETPPTPSGAAGSSDGGSAIPVCNECGHGANHHPAVIRWTGCTYVIEMEGGVPCKCRRLREEVEGDIPAPSKPLDAGCPECGGTKYDGRCPYGPRNGAWHPWNEFNDGKCARCTNPFHAPHSQPDAQGQG